MEKKKFFNLLQNIIFIALKQAAEALSKFSQISLGIEVSWFSPAPRYVRLWRCLCGGDGGYDEGMRLSV